MSNLSQFFGGSNLPPKHIEEFFESRSYTIPRDCRMELIMIGGGGGGHPNHHLGGGGGGVVYNYSLVVKSGDVVNITCGAPGAASLPHKGGDSIFKLNGATLATAGGGHSHTAVSPNTGKGGVCTGANVPWVQGGHGENLGEAAKNVIGSFGGGVAAGGGATASGYFGGGGIAGGFGGGYQGADGGAMLKLYWED